MRISHTSHPTNGTQLKVFAFCYSTPAWNLISGWVGPWSWNNFDGGRFEGPVEPSNWYPYSLLTEFLCALEPCELIVNKSHVNFPSSGEQTMELFAIIQCSPATAEGSYWHILDPQASVLAGFGNADDLILISLRLRPIECRSTSRGPPKNGISLDEVS